MPEKAENGASASVFRLLFFQKSETKEQHLRQKEKDFEPGACIEKLSSIYRTTLGFREKRPGEPWCLFCSVF